MLLWEGRRRLAIMPIPKARMLEPIMGKCFPSIPAMSAMKQHTPTPKAKLFILQLVSFMSTIPFDRYDCDELSDLILKKKGDKIQLCFMMLA